MYPTEMLGQKYIHLGVSSPGCKGTRVEPRGKEVIRR